MKHTESSTLSRRHAGALIAAGCAAIGCPALAATGRPIRAGISAGVSGPIAQTVNAYLAGLQRPLERLNAQGGLDGRRIELTVLDDQYQSALAVSNTQALLEKNADVLLGYPGTGTVEKTLGFLSGKEALLFGPYTGAAHLRALNSPNVIFVLGDYRSEVDRLVEHFATVGSSRFAMVFQNDSFGQPLADYARAALADRKLAAPLAIAVEPGQPIQPEQAARIVRSAPHAVLMFTVAGPTIASLRQLRRQYAGNVGVLSFLSNRAFIGALGPDAAGVVISQVVPGPYNLNHPLVREILSATQRGETAELTHAFIAGYLTSRLFIETLKLAGGRPQPEPMRAAWNQLKVRKPFGFSFNDRGAQYADIAMLRQDGRFVH